MRLNDILDENILNELTYGQTSSRSNNTSAKPQSFLSRVGTGIASTFHPNSNVRARAGEINKAGKEANKLMSDYQKWIARSGFEGPTKENLIKWMTSQRLPLDGRVKQALDKIVIPTTPAPGGPTTPTRIEPTLEAAGGTETPITNQQVSDILSTALMDISAGGGTAPTASPGAPTSPGVPRTASPTTASSTTTAPASPTTTSTAPASPAPSAPKSLPVAANLESIKKAYSLLEPAEREQLKKELEIIDDQERLASGTNESVGYSRFLGMKL